MQNNTRWTIIVLCLMFIWASLWVLFYLKADEVTKDPCSICSKKMGKEVVCTIQANEKHDSLTRTYLVNGSIEDPILPISRIPTKAIRPAKTLPNSPLILEPISII